MQTQLFRTKLILTSAHKKPNNYTYESAALLSETYPQTCKLSHSFNHWRATAH